MGVLSSGRRVRIRYRSVRVCGLREGLVAREGFETLLDIGELVALS